MQVGKWLDQQGIDVKPSARPSAAPAALPLLPAHKATEKLLAAVYAPWNDIDNGKHHPVKVNLLALLLLSTTMREPCLAPDRDQPLASLFIKGKRLWKLKFLFCSSSACGNGSTQ